MAGTDTVRGIAYQQAQAVLIALDLLGDDRIAALRVEGTADVIDVDLLNNAGETTLGKQMKTRSDEYTWGRSELVAQVRRWAELKPPQDATFEFLTDGRLGPSGEEVKTALWEAAHGDRSRLSMLLAEDRDSALCRAASRASIRIDPTGVASLLSRAERQLAAMLPPTRTRADTMAMAQSGVDTLFRLLIDRAGQHDASARVVTRDELAAAAGVSLELSTLRWETDYIDRYTAATKAEDLGHLVPLEVLPIDLGPVIRPRDGEPTGELGLAQVLHHRVALIAGRTGTGKSSAARLLARLGAEANRPVLLAHAESYIAGQLNALAADAIGVGLGEEVSSAVGREALADESATLVIDGVSELSHLVREALEEDLASWVASARGCRLVLMGRDVAALRSVLPTSASPGMFHIAPLTPELQLDLTQRALANADAERQLARVRRVIGDGVDNPLLLAMALTVSAEEVEFVNRASLYDAFLALMAARSGTPGIDVIATTLGVLFAGLLDDERRYADAFDWRTRLVHAVRVVGTVAGSISHEEIDKGSRKAGIVVPIDFTETMVPVHDSFADFLAGKAHARAIVPLPQCLTSADEQRVLFTAECGGVDAHLARQVVLDLPFVAPRLAPHDRRQLGESSLAEVEQLLEALLPSGVDSHVAAWEVGDGRTVLMMHDDRKWLDRNKAAELMARTRSVVLENPSPVQAAVRLWRDWLDASLVARVAVGVPKPMSQGAAVSALQGHAEATARMLPEVIARTAPARGSGALAAEVGPSGIVALVHPSEAGPFGDSWPVSYRMDHYVEVRVTTQQRSHLDPTDHLGGRSDVEYLTHDSPERTAVKTIREAINRLTVARWLG